jgi:hypothetical protein
VKSQGLTPWWRNLELWRVNKIQIVIGGGVLFVGFLYYLFDRPPDQTYFLLRANIPISLYRSFPIVLGDIGGWLPAFVHVFSFTLITAGLIGCRQRGIFIVCSIWFLMDGTFELGQKYHAMALRVIPDWFERIPFLENSANYFVRGTFDFLDLVGMSVGSLIAYLFLMSTMQRRDA